MAAGPGLFTRIEKAAVSTGGSQDLPLALLHRMECKACPLDCASAKTPKMQPSGSDTPSIYFLGDYPTAEDDAKGSQFSGSSGLFLRDLIPERWQGRIRFNNTIRTRPQVVKDIDQQVVECCRPSVQRDIEQHKPKAIFGFGRHPLQWATGEASTASWRGRYLPVKIGNHVCWFFSLLSPAFVQASTHDPKDQLGEDWERTFKRDLRNAFQLTEKLPEASIYDISQLDVGIEYYTGKLGDLERLRAHLEVLSKEPKVSVDLETSHLRPYYKGAKILSVGIGTDTSVASIALGHSKAQWAPHQQEELALLLYEFFSTNQHKFGHNFGFDLEWLIMWLSEAIAYTSGWGDSRMQAYILDERNDVQSLDDLTAIYLGFRVKALSNVNKAHLDSAPLLTVLKYMAYDVKTTFLVEKAQTERLAAVRLSDVYEFHRERLPTCSLAQIAGLDVDPNAVLQHRKRLTGESNRIKALIQNHPDCERFRALFGEFNPGSNQDVQRLFRDVLKLGGQDPKAKFSVDEAALEQIDHPIAKQILEMRKTDKLISTYVDPLDRATKDTVVFPDGKLHTEFKTTVTATGRLSSADPNIQNFPKRKNVEVRSQIVAPPGHVLVAADYGQIEARLIAIASKDKFLMKALWEDYDVHMYWAERVVKVHPYILEREGSLKGVRSCIKNDMVFPAFYGSTMYSIARNLDADPRVIAPLFEDFWRQHQGVKSWQDDLLNFYNSHGYVECLNGRRRRGPMTPNMVINSSIQGQASDIVVDAWTRLSREAVATERPYLQARMNIHDDLTFAVPEDPEILHSAIETIIRRMCCVPFKWVSVPMQIEVSVGRSWHDMHEIGKFRSDTLDN